MYYQIVFDFDEDDHNPHYSIRQRMNENALEDSTTAIIDPTLAEQHKIAIDCHGFPTSDSLEAWHRKYNPHLFTD